MRVDCKTQSECDKALKDGHVPVLVGGGYFSIYATAYVVARDSYVEAWDSHVVALGSSHVVAWYSHVEARGSSHVEARDSHVVARQSSHVEAWGSSHIEAWGSSHVVASKLVAVHVHSKESKVSGGVKIVVKAPTTRTEWCEFYGAKKEGSLVTLYKAVRDDFRSAHNFLYLPGTTPKAPDWDGGKKECSGGLHFCAHPIAALEFDSEATRFVACPVAFREIVVHKNAYYPNKVKAPRVAGPIYEVNRYGERIESNAIVTLTDEKRKAAR